MSINETVVRHYIYFFKSMFRIYIIKHGTPNRSVIKVQKKWIISILQSLIAWSYSVYISVRISEVCKVDQAHFPTLVKIQR